MFETYRLNNGCRCFKRQHLGKAVHGALRRAWKLFSLQLFDKNYSSSEPSSFDNFAVGRYIRLHV